MKPENCSSKNSGEGKRGQPKGLTKSSSKQEKRTLTGTAVIEMKFCGGTMRKERSPIIPPCATQHHPLWWTVFDAWKMSLLLDYFSASNMHSPNLMFSTIWHNTVNKAGVPSSENWAANCPQIRARVFSLMCLRNTRVCKCLVWRRQACLLLAILEEERGKCITISEQKGRQKARYSFV